ncbi:hypothetical protein ACWDUL_21250 [Nocardia niigatensis]
MEQALAALAARTREQDTRHRTWVPELSVRELRELKEATLHRYTTGRWPPAMPERLQMFLDDNPDGGLLVILTQAIHDRHEMYQARTERDRLAATLTEHKEDGSTPEGAHCE